MQHVRITTLRKIPSQTLPYLCKAILKLNNIYYQLTAMQTSAWILNIQLILLLYFFALNEFLGQHSYFIILTATFFASLPRETRDKINDKIFLRCSAYVCLIIRINITTGSLLPLIGLGSALVGFMWIEAFYWPSSCLPFTLLTVHATPSGGGGGEVRGSMGLNSLHLQFCGTRSGGAAIHWLPGYWSGSVSRSGFCSGSGFIKNFRKKLKSSIFFIIFKGTWQWGGFSGVFAEIGSAWLPYTTFRAVAILDSNSWRYS
jgi:hypothetical protein